MCDFSKKNNPTQTPTPKIFFLAELLIHAENAIEKICQANKKGFFDKNVKNQHF